MKIVYKNLKKGEIEVSIDSNEDLWYLSNIINIKDRVGSVTTRKIKINGASDRKANVVQKKMYIVLSVEKIELNLGDSVLRVLGKIVSTTDNEVPLGSYHSFNLTIDSKVKVIKDQWLKYQLNLIREATDENKSKVLIIAFDRDSASFAEINSKINIFEVLKATEFGISEKLYTKKETKFFDIIVKEANKLLERNKYNGVLWGSSLMFINDIKRKVNEMENLRKVSYFSECHNTGERGILEIIKRDEFKKILEKESIRKAEVSVDNLLSNIKKSEKYAYGFRDVSRAVDSGAVEELLITTGFIKRLSEKGVVNGNVPRRDSGTNRYKSEQKDLNEKINSNERKDTSRFGKAEMTKDDNSNGYNAFEKLMQIFKTVESTQGKITIINSDYEAGRKLDSLSGIGAILRYNI